MFPFFSDSEWILLRPVQKLSTCTLEPRAGGRRAAEQKRVLQLGTECSNGTSTQWEGVFKVMSSVIMQSIMHMYIYIYIDLHIYIYIYNICLAHVSGRSSTPRRSVTTAELAQPAWLSSQGFWVSRIWSCWVLCILWSGITDRYYYHCSENCDIDFCQAWEIWLNWYFHLPSIWSIL